MTNLFVKGFFENYEIIEKIIKRPYKKLKDEFKNIENGEKIVFTGFRNKGWELQLERMGHKVTSSVSGKTNLLVYGDEPGATKMNKAKELGIPIMHFNEFKEKYNLK